ncbi:hypothetical protein M404DRAFT_23181 [Pisolithus tinctorius Marx 270]|uniref:Uncharacterized protein n=1 Tax=Pisolithus tinctorius Marx 270 TaxID=870435 RepID=A0A0C3JFQ8_PISTI|nr:hypothetical protein M404DRAFT_23181 [Pisolithus tinctorius Marx 270]
MSSAEYFAKFVPPEAASTEQISKHPRLSHAPPVAFRRFGRPEGIRFRGF